MYKTQGLENNRVGFNLSGVSLAVSDKAKEVNANMLTSKLVTLNEVTHKIVQLTMYKAGNRDHCEKDHTMA